MINPIRNSVFTKIFWGLMGLYLLNISVDAPDLNPEHIPEDLSINDQESVIEIVVEKILGYENAIKEYDDHDTEDHNNKTNVKINLIAPYTIGSDINISLKELAKQQFSGINAYLANGFYHIDTPPPKI